MGTIKALIHGGLARTGLLWGLLRLYEGSIKAYCGDDSRGYFGDFKPYFGGFRWRAERA